MLKITDGVTEGEDEAALDADDDEGAIDNSLKSLPTSLAEAESAPAGDSGVHIEVALEGVAVALIPGGPGEPDASRAASAFTA